MFDSERTKDGNLRVPEQGCTGKTEGHAVTFTKFVENNEKKNKYFLFLFHSIILSKGTTHWFEKRCEWQAMESHKTGTVIKRQNKRQNQNLTENLSQMDVTSCIFWITTSIQNQIF
jgi:hypothetical protein